MKKQKYNVAVIGCGEISGLHIKGVLAKEECVLYAVCDPATDDRLQRQKERYGAQLAVTDYRELVNDPNVDVVIVETPDNTHMEITCAFLRAGKDVLLEKPMALSNEECEEMLRVRATKSLRASLVHPRSIIWRQRSAISSMPLLRASPIPSVLWRVQSRWQCAAQL